MKFKCGNTVIFANHLGGKGDSTGQHVHGENGHTTFCAQGSLRLERWMNGVDQESEVLDVPAGGFAYIAQNVVHNVTALEDDSSYACIWALVVDENNVPLPGQLDGISLEKTDEWNKLKDAPWLKYL